MPAAILKLSVYSFLGAVVVTGTPAADLIASRSFVISSGSVSMISSVSLPYFASYASDVNGLISAHTSRVSSLSVVDL